MELIIIGSAAVWTLYCVVRELRTAYSDIFCQIPVRFWVSAEFRRIISGIEPHSILMLTLAHVLVNGALFLGPMTACVALNDSDSWKSVIMVLLFFTVPLVLKRRLLFRYQTNRHKAKHNRILLFCYQEDFDDIPGKADTSLRSLGDHIAFVHRLYYSGWYTRWFESRRKYAIATVIQVLRHRYPYSAVRQCFEKFVQRSQGQFYGKVDADSAGEMLDAMLAALSYNGRALIGRLEQCSEQRTGDREATTGPITLGLESGDSLVGQLRNKSEQGYGVVCGREIDPGSRVQVENKAGRVVWSRPDGCNGDGAWLVGILVEVEDP